MAWKRNKLSTFFKTISPSLLFIIILLTSSNNSIYSQNDALQKEHWEEVIKDYDYGEVEKSEEKDDSATSSRNSSSGFNWSINPEVLKVAAISIIIILLTLLILQLMGIKLINKKIDRKQVVNYDQLGNPIPPDEKGAIYETEFERELRLALEAQDYRKAIRIYFVTIVDELSVAQLIKKEKDKTNQRYISELRGKKEQAPFRKLSRVFEIVWFGEVNLSEEEYQQLAPSFNHFLKELIAQ